MPGEGAGARGYARKRKQRQGKVASSSAWPESRGGMWEVNLKIRLSINWGGSLSHAGEIKCDSIGRPLEVLE